jgi:hypothetical protein
VFMDDPKVGYREISDALNSLDNSLGCICLSILALTFVVGVVAYIMLKH